MLASRLLYFTAKYASLEASEISIQCNHNRLGMEGDSWTIDTYIHNGSNGRIVI